MFGLLLLAAIAVTACAQEPSSTVCSSNQSCAAGFLCIAGTCQREELFSDCQSDLDCNLDQYCDLNLQLCINLDSGIRRMPDSGLNFLDAEDSGAAQMQSDSGLDASVSLDSGVGFSDAGAEARIFVSKTGDDSADGLSPQTSLLTIQAGLSKSRECQPSPCEVLISVGNYSEQVILHDGASLWGGFSEDFARQDPMTWPVTITSTQARSVIGDGLSQEVRLSGLSIQGADLSSFTDGRSVYALWLRDSSTVVLAYVTGSGGVGAQGAAGEDGVLSIFNSPGGQGGTAYDCGSRNGASGEAGGDPTSGGAGGGGGSSNCPNACPLVGGQGVSRGDHGLAGGNGADGAGGNAALDNIGEWSNESWRGAVGQAGTRGAHGTGGGGGGSGGTKRFRACFGCGSLLGGRGGNGAPGGCGGGGGGPASPGGGSFGVALMNSTLQLERSSVFGGWVAEVAQVARGATVSPEERTLPPDAEMRRVSDVA